MPSAVYQLAPGSI